MATLHYFVFKKQQEQFYLTKTRAFTTINMEDVLHSVYPKSKSCMKWSDVTYQVSISMRLQYHPKTLTLNMFCITT